jgi:hypothetical protein
LIILVPGIVTNFVAVCIADKFGIVNTKCVVEIITNDILLNFDIAGALSRPVAAAPVAHVIKLLAAIFMQWLNKLVCLSLHVFVTLD